MLFLESVYLEIGINNVQQFHGRIVQSNFWIALVGLNCCGPSVRQFGVMEGLRQEPGKISAHTARIRELRPWVCDLMLGLLAGPVAAGLDQLFAVKIAILFAKILDFDSFS